MTIDDPDVLAEVTAAFYEYERALMADDVPAMDRLFADAPTTVRYGVGEVLYGADEIREFRKGRGGSSRETSHRAPAARSRGTCRNLRSIRSPSCAATTTPPNGPDWLSTRTAGCWVRRMPCTR